MQIARPKVIISAELLTEAIGAEQWNLGFSLQFETAPNQPKIQIETPWRIDRCAYNVQIRRNRMLADFIPELLAESDDVVARLGFAGNVAFHMPEPHMIEEAKPQSEFLEFSRSDDPFVFLAKHRQPPRHVRLRATVFRPHSQWPRAPS